MYTFLNDCALNTRYIEQEAKEVGKYRHWIEFKVFVAHEKCWDSFCDRIEHYFMVVSQVQSNLTQPLIPELREVDMILPIYLKTMTTKVL